MADDIPDLEHAPIWGPMSKPPICPEPTIEQALAMVLTFGDSMRRCSACGSPATDITAQEWALGQMPDGGDNAEVLVHETCGECSNECQYVVTDAMWTSMEAMRVWEQGRTALAAMRAHLEIQGDLDELDEGAPIPRAQFCTRCNRYLESRDGKAPCICPNPKIVER